MRYRNTPTAIAVVITLGMIAGRCGDIRGTETAATPSPAAKTVLVAQSSREAPATDSAPVRINR